MKNTKGAMSAGLVVVLLVAALLLYNQGFFGGILGSSVTPTGTTVPATDANTIKVQSSVEDVTTTLRARDAFSAGTNMDAQGLRVFLKNGLMTDKGTVANGNSITLSPADEIVIYAAENSSNYYTRKLSEIIPNKGTKEITAELCAFDTAPTFTMKDSQGTVNTAQAVGANDKKVVSVSLESSSQKCLGNPYITDKMNSMCFKYNNTAITGVTLVENGVNRPTTSIPQNISNDFAGTGFNVRCFSYPVLKNTQKWEGQVVIESGATQPVANSHHINVSIDDADFDLDGDTLAEITGAEDEDSNNLGQASIRAGNILLS